MKGMGESEGVYFSLSHSENKVVIMELERFHSLLLIIFCLD